MKTYSGMMMVRSKKRVLLWVLSPMIFSISHSGSPPSILMGGGSRKFGPCISVSLKGVRSEAWNTRWIFQIGGSWRRYAMGEITAATLKGPYCFGDSFANL